MSDIFGGGGDDSGVDAQIALEQQEYNDETFDANVKKADLNNELFTDLHAASGPIFGPVSTGETVNPEGSSGSGNSGGKTSNPFLPPANPLP